MAISVVEEKWCNGASVEGPKTCTNDKYSPWVNNCKHKAERQENKHGKKKPYAVVQYNKYMKDRPVPQFLLGSEEHCTMVDKSGTMSAKLCSSTHFCTQDTHKFKQKSKYNTFLQEVGRCRISEVQNRSWVQFWSSTDTEANTIKRGLKRTRQADSPGISGYTNSKKCLLVGTETRGILQDSVKIVLHVSSKVKLETCVNYALFCFTKGLVLRNTIQWQTTRLSTCSIWSLGLNSIIYSAKL
jgi:hypothetical protein